MVSNLKDYLRSSYPAYIGNTKPEAWLYRDEICCGHGQQNQDSVLVIIIDDEASIREGTKNLLQLWGYDVIAVADKQEAMVQIRQ